MPRKFTPPDVFPSDYMLPCGGKAQLIAPMPDGLGYVGVVYLSDGSEHGQIWNNEGYDPDDQGLYDLSDIPVRVTLYRSWGLQGTHIVTCNKDGTDPTVKWKPKL